MTPKTITATVTTPDRNVWVLAEVPTNEQVQPASGDSAVKNRILEVLQEIRDSGAQVGVGEEGNPNPAVPQLVILLADLQDIRPDLKIKVPLELAAPPQPSDQGQTFTVRLCLDYTIPVGLPGSVEINISTLAGATAALADIPSFTLADAADRFRGHPEGSIPIRLVYAQKDLDDARKDPTVTSDADALLSVRTELLKVAATAFDKAKDKKLLGEDGRPLVDRNTGQEQAANTAEALKSFYNLNAQSTQVHWGFADANAQVRDLTPSAPWIISVTGLQLAQRVDIDVTKSAVESEFDGSPTEKIFEKKRQKVRDQLRADHLRGFSAKPGHIINAQDIDADQTSLRSDSKTVKSVDDITSGSPPANGATPPQNLIYTVSRHLKAEKTLGVKLGGSYSPEESVTGNVGFDEVNMLGFSESAKLDYSGGPQVQKIKFNFERPFDNSGTAGWYIKTLGVNVQYFGDKDKRFANLTAQEIEARETGSEARFSFGYDSFSILDHAAADCLADTNRKRTRLSLLATPLLGYRDVNIKEDNLLLTITKIDRSLLPRARTQTTTLSLDTNLGLSHDFRQAQRAGLGMVNFYLTSRLQRGVRFLGADYKYNKSGVSLTGEIFFGFRSPKDLFLRYNRAMGTSTRGTPIFELFRLGGAQTVRGLEEGEIIGRKMSADQLELGINAMVLWHVITRKPLAEDLMKDNCAVGAEESQSKLPFDINKAYLKFFYDRGRIHDRDSFTVPGGVNRIAEGYGIAFEVRELGGKNINLTIGYAYSPESRIHKRGTLYTGVSYAF